MNVYIYLYNQSGKVAVVGIYVMDRIKIKKHY